MVLVKGRLWKYLLRKLDRTDNHQNECLERTVQSGHSATHGYLSIACAALKQLLVFFHCALKTE